MVHHRQGRRPRSLSRATLSACLAVGTLGFLVAASVDAARIVMKDGRTLVGRQAPIPSVIDSPRTASFAKTIVMIDDGLRRIYVPLRHVQESLHDTGESPESFHIQQQATTEGVQVADVGAIFNVGKFDDFGRRKFMMDTNLGRQWVIQGITEITPEWTKLECIDAEKMHFIWDMRVATNSIPRSTLDLVLSKQPNADSLDHRLKVARLYIQSERFQDAEAELTGILKAFPNLPANQKQTFEQTRIRLRQTGARRILTEIETRKKAGQHEFANSLLNAFPVDNVAGETLQAVSGLLKEYKQIDDRRAEALRRFEILVNQIKDSALRGRLADVREEIKTELKTDTIDRMAAFMQFQADDEMTPEEKVALAVSGWLGGSDFAVRNLPVAISMFEVRQLINQYLNETSRRAGDVRLGELLAAMRRQEGFTPELTARLLTLLKPPLTIKEEEVSKKVVGLCEMQVADIPNQVPIDYFVQLPREYDPHRRYPTIVALHASGMAPSDEIDWWAGAPNIDGQRFGQADRHGYIVIAPAWAKEQQLNCHYSEDEHGAVLYALRDAMRKFSIDTDRVFISGHSMGGDAAWDIALAHPDIWAGFIGVTPVADKTISLYQENAKYLPTYLIFGEKDGAIWVKDATNLDYYLSNGLNSTVVQFKGRGHEHFSDELLRLFDWMGRQKRDFSPKDFKCRSIRLWDTSFWWVEAHDPPERSLIDPDTWPHKVLGVIHTSGKLNAQNGLRVDTQCASATVWLTPDLINFKVPCEITINNKVVNKLGSFIEPDSGVMMEDARTRSDRQHPFWAKVEKLK